MKNPIKLVILLFVSLFLNTTLAFSGETEPLTPAPLFPPEILTEIFSKFPEDPFLASTPYRISNMTRFLKLKEAIDIDKVSLGIQHSTQRILSRLNHHLVKKKSEKSARYFELNYLPKNLFSNLALITRKLRSCDDQDRNSNGNYLNIVLKNGLFGIYKKMLQAKFRYSHHKLELEEMLKDPTNPYPAETQAVLVEFDASVVLGNESDKRISRALGDDVKLDQVHLLILNPMNRSERDLILGLAHLNPSADREEFKNQFQSRFGFFPTTKFSPNWIVELIGKNQLDEEEVQHILWLVRKEFISGNEILPALATYSTLSEKQILAVLHLARTYAVDEDVKRRVILEISKKSPLVDGKISKKLSESVKKLSKPYQAEFIMDYLTQAPKISSEAFLWIQRIARDLAGSVRNDSKKLSKCEFRKLETYRQWISLFDHSAQVLHQVTVQEPSSRSLPALQ